MNRFACCRVHTADRLFRQLGVSDPQCGPYNSSRIISPVQLLILALIGLWMGALPARTIAAPPTTSPATTLHRPPLAPAIIEKTDITDEQIGQASQRGVDWLLGRFSPATGQIEPKRATDLGHFAGINALCVYALIESGRVLNDQRIVANSASLARLTDAMKAPKSAFTYDLAIRLAALSVYARPQDRAAMIEHANALVNGQRQGAYTYTALAAGRDWDNSNTQYGIMGVWAAADAGLEIPPAYWKIVLDHWKRTQHPSGQWSYQLKSTEWVGRGAHSDDATSTMTEAGIASLLVARDYVDRATFHGEVGIDPWPPELRKALDWWETGDNAVTFDKDQVFYQASYGYWLFGVSRVGLASGLKYFGSHDWYRQLSAQLIRTQHADGSWGNEMETAEALLFLARGRSPILMNKLRFEHAGQPELNNRYWNNRARDLANLSRWSSRQLERPLNWQIVDLSREWFDWLDAPILYFASHRPISLTDADCDKLRAYVQAGGILFTQADGDDPSFDRFIRDLCRRLFPRYELADLPADHPLYSSNFHLPGRPALKAVSNGVRLLLIYAPNDIARYWHAGDTDVHRNAFELGLNLFVYAAGKRDLRNRLDSPYVPAPTGKPVLTVNLGRIKYDGNWNPEPGDFDRFQRIFQTNTGYELNIHELSLGQLDASIPLCHLTGTDRFQATEEAVRGIRAYVEAGGVLFIDAAGGSKAFVDSARKTLLQAFSDRTLRYLPLDHKLLTATVPGMFDLRKPRLRPYVLTRFDPRSARLEILSAGKGHVLFSELDVTSGLLGTGTWGILGYAPDYSTQLLQNLVLWTLDGSPDD